MHRGLMEEIWKFVLGQEDYQVSDQGRVRSLRSGNGRKPKNNPQWRIVTPCPYPKGYLSVSIDGELQLVQVLVLEAFVRPRQEGEQACHFPDRNTKNNNLNNLRWASQAENRHDAALHGTLHEQKLTPDDVLDIRAWTEGSVTQQQASELAQEYGVSQSTIKNVVYGQTWPWLSDRIRPKP